MNEVIHIGYPKTASTWLQDEYFPKVKNYHFVSWREVNNQLVFSDSLNFDPEEIKKHFIDKMKCSKLLLSSEHLTTAINFGWHFGNYSIANAYKIKAVYPNAKIVIFIRKQQSLICSAYLQYVKNGGTYSFKKWAYSGKNFSFKHLLFTPLVELYDSLFGVENVFVYLYEDFQNSPILFLERFNNDLEIEIDLKTISLKPINRALRKRTVPFIRFLNLFFSDPLGQKFYLIHIPGMGSISKQIMKRINRSRLLGVYLSDKNMLTPKDIDYIRDFYADSNKKLSKRLGVNISDYGYFLQK